MEFVIKFINKSANRAMIICNADGSLMTFTSKDDAQAMAWRFEDQYGEIHWAEAR